MQLIWPWQDRQRKFSWLKASGFALALFPGLRFVYQFAVGDYGFLPIALGGLVYWSGVWATVVLLMALAVTPVMTVLRWPALVDVRRIIGVTALVYTLVHVIFYFMLRSWNWPVILPELVARTSMVVGVISTIGLIVLGATSLDAVIRAHGDERLAAPAQHQLRHQRPRGASRGAVARQLSGAVPARRAVCLADGLARARPVWPRRRSGRAGDPTVA